MNVKRLGEAEEWRGKGTTLGGNHGARLVAAVSGSVGLQRLWDVSDECGSRFRRAMEQRTKVEIEGGRKRKGRTNESCLDKPPQGAMKRPADRYGRKSGGHQQETNKAVEEGEKGRAKATYPRPMT